MKKYLLDHSLVNSIEYFRSIDGLSYYGILDGIVSESRGDGEFYQHAQKVLKYFNDFDEKENDWDFMKCMLGQYEVKPFSEIEKTACFTGHRPHKLNGYHMFDNIPLMKSLRESIIDHIENKGVTTFVSGMALGVDMWAASLVISLKKDYPDIKLVAALPCHKQWSKWEEESVDEWVKIVSSVDLIHYVSKEDYTPWCMNDRNEWMVDNSKYIIAVWDGTSGGTKNCVDYGEKNGKIIVQINPKELK